MDINNLCDKPEEYGFTVKVKCENCGSDNYYQNNQSAMDIGCIKCMPSSLPIKGDE